MPNAPCGEDKRKRVEDEGPLVADGDDGGAEKGSNRQRHPLGSLRERVRGMELFGTDDRGQDRGTPRGEKGRGGISSPLNT